MFRTANITTAALAAISLIAHTAKATEISIGLQEAGVNNGNIITVATDTSSPGSAGVLNLNYGTFAASTISATGSPITPEPQFLTNSIDVNSSGGTAGVLTVYITETGLTYPAGINLFASSFTSNVLAGSITAVTEKTLISTTDSLYSGTTLATANFTTIKTLTDDDYSPALGATYSETVEYIITAASGYGDTNDTIDISMVPEPGSLALLGSGLLGIGWLRRRGLKPGASLPARIAV
jgi:hypothetical protein